MTTWLPAVNSMRQQLREFGLVGEVLGELRRPVCR